MGDSFGKCCSLRDKDYCDHLPVSKELPSVYIIPGMCSNALEVKTQDMDQHEVAYVNIPHILENGPEFFHELELSLVDGEMKNGDKVKTVQDCNFAGGAHSRPVQGLAGCAHLDPQAEIPLIPLWMPIIKLLSGTHNVRACNYDWRKWGCQKVAEEVLDTFRQQIEELVKEGESRVTIICHSMGAQVVLYCLGELGEKWEEDHVKHLIFCAPAASGTPVLFPCYANGPVGNMDGGMLNMPIEVASQDLTRITASFPCMMAEMPTNTGNDKIWPKDKVFASTPSKKYTVDNIASFLQDTAKCGKEANEWQVAKTLWPGFQKMVAKYRAPLVRADIIYSKSEKTLAEVKYNSEDLMEKPDPDSYKYEGGDTTILGSSTEAMHHNWVQKRGKKARVYLHPTPEDAHVTHSGCISAPWVLDKIPELLSFDGKSAREVSTISSGN